MSFTFASFVIWFVTDYLNTNGCHFFHIPETRILSIWTPCSTCTSTRYRHKLTFSYLIPIFNFVPTIPKGRICVKATSMTHLVGALKGFLSLHYGQGCPICQMGNDVMHDNHCWLFIITVRLYHANIFIQKQFKHLSM